MESEIAEKVFDLLYGGLGFLNVYATSSDRRAVFGYAHSPVIRSAASEGFVHGMGPGALLEELFGDLTDEQASHAALEFWRYCRSRLPGAPWGPFLPAYASVLWAEADESAEAMFPTEFDSAAEVRFASKQENVEYRLATILAASICNLPDRALDLFLGLTWTHELSAGFSPQACELLAKWFLPSLASADPRVFWDPAGMRHRVGGGSPQELASNCGRALLAYLDNQPRWRDDSATPAAKNALNDWLRSQVPSGRQAGLLGVLTRERDKALEDRNQIAKRLDDVLGRLLNTQWTSPAVTQADVETWLETAGLDLAPVPLKSSSALKTAVRGLLTVENDEPTRNYDRSLALVAWGKAIEIGVSELLEQRAGVLLDVAIESYDMAHEYLEKLSSTTTASNAARENAFKRLSEVDSIGQVVNLAIELGRRDGLARTWDRLRCLNNLQRAGQRRGAYWPVEPLDFSTLQRASDPKRLAKVLRNGFAHLDVEHDPAAVLTRFDAARQQLIDFFDWLATAHSGSSCEDPD